MPIISTYAQLRALPVSELVRLYDSAAPHVDLGVAFLREEIARRDAAEQTMAISDMTRQVKNMTLWITVLTAMNVAFTAILLFK